MRLTGYSVIARAIPILTLVALLAIMPPQTISGDIGDDDAHLGFLGLEDTEEEDRGPRWITRNLPVGAPLQVCSTAYPTATSIAIQRWNIALGVTVLRLAEDCDTSERAWDPQDGVVNLTVTKGDWDDDGETEYRGKVLVQSCTGFGGCAGFDEMSRLTERNKAWRTYHGRAEVVMNPTTYSHDYNPDKATNVIRDIAHEIGHILALADWFCHVPNDGFADVSLNPDRIDPPTRTLMNSITVRSGCNSLDDRPTDKDKVDYRSIYLPAKVTDVATQTNGRLVTLTWNQSDVFVESHFEVQRKNGSSWEYVVEVEANARSITLAEQPGGPQIYRVVSRTQALPLKQSPTDFGYTDEETASEEVSVTVQFPSPANLRITNLGTNSLTVAWDDVQGADGYEVRIRATASSNCYQAPLREFTTDQLSQPIAGLNASTSYLLCVRAVLSDHEAAGSDWTRRWATTATPPTDPTVVEPEEPTGLNCLTSRDTGVLIAWKRVCGSTTVSVLLPKLVAGGVNVIGMWKWIDPGWLMYAKVDGRVIPGSTNFTISGGDELWLIAASSARADGVWTPPPAPTAEELKRLAKLAAQ